MFDTVRCNGTRTYDEREDHDDQKPAESKHNLNVAGDVRRPLEADR